MLRVFYVIFMLLGGAVFVLPSQTSNAAEPGEGHAKMTPARLDRAMLIIRFLRDAKDSYNQKSQSGHQRPESAVPSFIELPIRPKISNLWGMLRSAESLPVHFLYLRQIDGTGLHDHGTEKSDGVVLVGGLHRKDCRIINHILWNDETIPSSGISFFTVTPEQTMRTSVGDAPPRDIGCVAGDTGEYIAFYALTIR